MKPSLSVVTITKDNIKELKKTLESLRTQGFQQWECIIVDGASNDGTKEFLETLCRQDLRFQHLSEKDKGIYDAQNKGVSLARADRILFLNAGDELCRSDALERCLPLISEAEVVSVFSVVLKSDNRFVRRDYPAEILAPFWFTSHLCHQACILHKSFFEDLGIYDCRLRYAADHKHFLRSFFECKHKWVSRSTPLCVFDMSGTSAADHNREKVLAEMAQNQRSHIPLLQRLFWGRRILWHNRIKKFPRSIELLLRLLLFPLLHHPHRARMEFDHELPSLESLITGPRVLLLNAFDAGGGAAKACMRLLDGLRGAGIDAHAAVLHKNTARPFVHELQGRPYPRKLFQFCRSRLAKLLLRLERRSRPLGQYSLSLVGFCELEDEVRHFRPDVLHFHWMGSGAATIEQMGQVMERFPTCFWSFHDMWPFCGSEHVTHSQRFKKGYLEQNRDDGAQGLDLAKWVWKRKRKATSSAKFEIITPSKWMTQNVQESALFSSRVVHTISHGIDTQHFAADSLKEQSRRVLSLPEDKKLLLFGAVDATKDLNKGYEHLSNALRILACSSSDFHLCILGFARERTLKALPFSSTVFGYQSNESVLRALYGACDLSLLPSELESFGQMALESIACSTPVVCFDTSGLKDVVSHKKDGYRARCYDSSDLAAGVEWCLETPERYAELCISGARKAKENFDISHYAHSHLKAYGLLSETEK